ncbi:MAG TPA: DUF5694 domain-containing protein [Flavitalea sp.]|nr:DUF5694 domain-containing protein [Flavitalea sp.]
MQRSAWLLLILLVSSGLKAQKVDWKKLDQLKPDKILLSGERQPTKVLLLGSFHFGYPNLDGHKTDSSKFVDVLSPARQKELDELVNVISRFKPTRIYVEGSSQQRMDSLYNNYVQGRSKLRRNEIDQIGFRLGKMYGLKKMFAVDATSFANDYYKTIPLLDTISLMSQPTDSIRDKYWSGKYTEMYDAGDSLDLTLTMLENFLLMAEPAVLRRYHGHYLSAGFNTINNAGPDLLSVWWYNRNLRIFNNILNTKPTANDQILILFGNGHMPILKQCFESSPEFQLVELKQLLK